MTESDKPNALSHFHDLGRTLAKAKAEAAPLGISWEVVLSRRGISTITARRAMALPIRIECLDESEKEALMKKSITGAMASLGILKARGRPDNDPSR